MSRTRLRAAGMAGAVLLSVTLAGCGGDEDTAVDDAQDVVAGVVLDGPDGAPLSGVDVELLVWPSPQANSTASVGEAPELLRVDEDTTGADGSFDLEAHAADLSPHAASDGQVGLEIRKVGAEGAGMRTSVRLSRGQDDGVITVHAVEDLTLTLAAIGDD